MKSIVLSLKRIQARIAQNKKRSLIAIFLIIVITLSICIPIANYMFSATTSSVMGDFQALGFDFSGNMRIDYAIGRKFVLIEKSYNISIPCEDSVVKSLQVIKSSGASSALLDTLVFNSSGKLNIYMNNVNFLTYELLGETNTASLSYQSSNFSAFLTDPGYPQAAMTLMTDPETVGSATISSTGRTSSIFLSFSAMDADLSVTGDDNFSLHLSRDDAGILLNVSTPINRAYSTIVNGYLSQISIENWLSSKVNFFRGPNQDNANASIFNPKGDLSFNDKKLTLTGSQDLDFANLLGVSYITPTTDAFFFRLLVNGDVTSVNAKSADNTSNITQKNFVDFTFPWPIIVIFFSLVALLRIAKLRIEIVLIPPVLVFFMVSLAWSISTNQQIWVQSFFSYAGLFITTIIFLIGTIKNRGTRIEEKENQECRGSNNSTKS